MDKTCMPCEEAGVEDIPATHTFYDSHNTMWWTCDDHAEQILNEAHGTPQEWIGCKLLPTVEESDPERRERLQRSNLLRFPIRAVA